MGIVLKNAEVEEDELRAAALRMARRCRHIIQGCLREEEWRDADAEFSAVILEELERLVGTRVDDAKLFGAKHRDLPGTGTK
jgi:hypothetical protein